MKRLNSDDSQVAAKLQRFDISGKALEVSIKINPAHNMHSYLPQCAPADESDNVARRRCPIPNGTSMGYYIDGGVETP